MVLHISVYSNRHLLKMQKQMQTKRQTQRMLQSTTRTAFWIILLLHLQSYCISHPIPFSQCHPSMLGPPPTLSSLSLGQTLILHRLSDTHRTFTAERISNEPNAFLLRNVLTKEECRDIIQEALTSNMTTAQTRGEEENSSRRQSSVAWLSSDKSTSTSMLSLLQNDVNSILVNPQITTAEHFRIEPLQVLQYQKGGRYLTHHDGHPRFLTVIHYLNGVAGTWFPFAKVDAVDPLDFLEEGYTAAEVREQFYQTRQNVGVASSMENMNVVPGTHGIVLVERDIWVEEGSPSLEESGIVPVDAGDALVFYNYETNYEDDDKKESNDDGIRIPPREDWRALHAGLPSMKGSKWIANHWFRYGE
uniref:Fe2OG dioxygenase domain-containing protein n=1 Tax=Ditylum brightwellii TaxID=49249 RepID=A0A7S4V4R4_9STRA